MKHDYPPFRVRCTWLVDYSSEWWHEAATLAGQRESQEIDPEDSDLVRLPLGPVFGSDVDSRLGLGWAERRNDGLRLTFDVMPRPNKPPPERYTRSNDRYSGRSGMLDLLSRTPSRTPPIAGYSIILTVPSSQYCCRLVPTRPAHDDNESALFGDLGRVMRREQIGFRFDSGTLGLEEVMIMYLHQQEELLLDIKARNPLKLGDERWFPLADDLVELVFERAFQKVMS